MSDLEIINQNKLIAIFMGGEYKTVYNGVDNTEAQRFYMPDSHITEPIMDFEYLDYHTDWNKLMPVVEKIEALGYFCMINKWTSVYTGSEGERISITSIEGNSKMINTYKAVSLFIEWYDKNITT